MQRFLTRFRVLLGFICAAAAFWLARPNMTSIYFGGAIALLGEALRIWAAGHIQKSREITRSGPYRYMRHPLYVGSSVLGIGFAIASRSVVVAVLAVLYLGLTLSAAVRTEEATLDKKFAGEYTAYKTGSARPVEKRFSLDLVMANREYRAAAGLVLAFAFLWLRMRSMA
jgi:protein-S-isoprenylcysteine O-methyltransferase Ste14